MTDKPEYTLMTFNEFSMLWMKQTQMQLDRIEGLLVKFMEDDVNLDNLSDSDDEDDGEGWKNKIDDNFGRF